MEQSPDHSELIELFAALPADVQALALASLKRLATRDPYTGPFGWQLGLRYTERAPGRTACALYVDETLHNPGRIAHGGVIYTLADSAMGAAVFTRLQPGQRCVTAELKLNYLAPVVRGEVIATATVVSMGKRLAIVTAEVRTADQQLVGLAQGTFAILQHTDAPPRMGDG